MCTEKKTGCFLPQNDKYDKILTATATVFVMNMEMFRFTAIPENKEGKYR